MIQGIAAALISLAEIHGIHATCFVLSSWIGGGLEEKDVDKMAAKLDDTLKGVPVSRRDIMKTWKAASGLSGVERSTLYL